MAPPDVTFATLVLANLTPELHILLIEGTNPKRRGLMVRPVGWSLPVGTHLFLYITSYSSNHRYARTTSSFQGMPTPNKNKIKFT